MNGFWVALGWVNENVALVGAEVAVLAGYSGAVLALMVLAVNLLCRRWLTASQMLLLWGLVLVRMALPIMPSSQASVHNVVIWMTSETVATDAAVSRDDLSQAYAIQSATDSVWAADATPTEVRAIMTAEQAATIAMIDDWIPLIWLAGVVLVLGWTFSTHWRFTRRIARVKAGGDERLLALWQRCREELGVRRAIPLVVCDEVAQPAVMGVWRPKLLLPAHCAELSDEKIRLVMLHELMHVRCWDVAVNWLLVLVRAAQWWNPFFWLAGSRFVNLREQSRDAMVLRHLNSGGDHTRAYADLLLSLAGRGVGQCWRVTLPASLLGFISSWFRKRAVANRLQAMVKVTRIQRRGHRAIVCVTILAVGVIGLTDADEPKSNTEPVYSDAWMRIADEAGQTAKARPSDVASPFGPFANEPLGPWSEQEYDVTQGAAVIMRQEGCSLEELPNRFQWHLISLVDPQRVSAQPTDKVATAAEPRTRSQGDTNETTGRAAPEVTSPRPHAELHREGERWMIRAAGPESMHQRFRQSTRAWNRGGWAQVIIETRIATTRNNVVNEIDLDSMRFKAATVGSQADFESDKEASEARQVNHDATAVAVSAVEHHIPVLIAVLSDEQTRQFLLAARGDEGSNIVFAPKVAMCNGQQAQMFSGAQRPFVVGVHERGDGGFDPQIRVVKEGFDLLLHPELTEGQDGVELAAKLDLSDIRDVQTFSTQVQGKDVAVQVPSVSHTRVQTTAQLKDDQTLLLCVPPTYDQKHYAWVLLTARIFQAAEQL